MRHDFFKVEYINTKFSSLKRNLKINNQFTKKINKKTRGKSLLRKL